METKTNILKEKKAKGNPVRSRNEGKKSGVQGKSEIDSREGKRGGGSREEGKGGSKNGRKEIG